MALVRTGTFNEGYGYANTLSGGLAKTGAYGCYFGTVYSKCLTLAESPMFARISGRTLISCTLELELMLALRSVLTPGDFSPPETLSTDG